MHPRYHHQPTLINQAQTLIFLCKGRYESELMLITNFCIIIHLNFSNWNLNESLSSKGFYLAFESVWTSLQPPVQAPTAGFGLVTWLHHFLIFPCPKPGYPLLKIFWPKQPLNQPQISACFSPFCGLLATGLLGQLRLKIVAALDCCSKW